MGTRVDGVAASGGSPTTTRGDIIRRGASADERLALGAAGKVFTSNGTDPVWSDAAGVSLSAANTFTAPQTFAIIDGHGGTVEEAGRFRHEASATSNGCGVAVALSKKTTGGAEVDLGVIVAVTRDDDAWIDVRPLRRVGASPTVGLRCRTTEADAVNGVEVLPKASGSAPIIQPCQSAVGNPDVGLRIRPSGIGLLDLVRPTLPSGTVAEIAAGAGDFASPGPGQLAFATDAFGGPTLAIYTGAAWVMVPTTPLAD